MSLTYDHAVKSVFDGSHLNEVKISSLRVAKQRATISFNQQKRREHLGSVLSFLLLFIKVIKETAHRFRGAPIILFRNII